MKKFYPVYLVVFFCMSTTVLSTEIGIVDLNEALNQSESGIRSKNILERRSLQKQKELRFASKKQAFRKKSCKREPHKKLKFPDFERSLQNLTFSHVEFLAHILR